MIERLYIENFRCFATFECTLGPRQLVLGVNGAGKSTLFDVLAALRDFCAFGVAPGNLFLGRTRTRWQDEPRQAFELDVSGNGGKYTLRLQFDSFGMPEAPRVLKEEVEFDGQPIFRFVNGEVHLFNDRYEDKIKYPFDWHRSALATIIERRENTKLSWFKRWLSRLVYVSPDPRRMQGIASGEIRAPDQYLHDFADWYRHLRQETEDYAYIADLKEVVENFIGMRLEDAGERRRELKIRMSAADGRKGSPTEQEYLLSEMSDGQRVLIGLYAVLHFGMRTESTLCYDEPDNFVALREIQPWLARTAEKAEEGSLQVLIASHHPELLNQMAFQEGIYLDRPFGRNTRARKFEDPAKTGLSAAELVARGWERE